MVADGINEVFFGESHGIILLYRTVPYRLVKFHFRRILSIISTPQLQYVFSLANE